MYLGFSMDSEVKHINSTGKDFQQKVYFSEISENVNLNAYACLAEAAGMIFCIKHHISTNVQHLSI